MISANELVRPFQKPNYLSAFKILLTSIIPYVLLLGLSAILMPYSYFWVLLLAIPAQCFHSRIFIVMHDCGHNSFMSKKIYNSLVGHIAAFFYWTPFFMWQELHNKHHRNQGNLDRRGNSLDVWTLTSAEYAKLNIINRFLYRAYRNPIVLLLLAPIVLFIFIFRVPFEKFSSRAVLNIIFVDGLILLVAFKYPIYILVQLPSLVISLVMASLLFYVQHQFENTLWTKGQSYSNQNISLQGSSYLKLPPFLNWTLGNIGFHHVHHLDVKIPMYELPNAHNALISEYSVKPLLASAAISSLRLRLWDEKSGKLVSF